MENSFSSVQLLSHVRLFVTPWIAAHQVALSITNSWSLPKLIHVHRVGDAIQPSHPLSSPAPPAPNPSQHQGLFQWVNSLHEVAKVLEFNFSMCPSNEHPGLISFRMDWLDLHAVQGTLKSLSNCILGHFFQGNRNRVYIVTCIQMFLHTLLIIAKNCKHPRYSAVEANTLIRVLWQMFMDRNYSFTIWSEFCSEIQ